MPIRWSHLCCLVLVLTALIGQSGCRGFIDQTDYEIDKQVEKFALSNQIPLDAFMLEILVVERPADDPLLGETLWKQIDEVGSIDFESRTRLKDLGLAVGLVGSCPPLELQRLLGIETRLTDRAGTSRETLISGNRLVLRDGEETHIQTSDPFKALAIPPQSELEDPQDFYNAQGMIRVRCERLQDGWLRLHILPEIHHGGERARPVANEQEWTIDNSKEIYPVHRGRVTLDLALNEIAVMTTDRNPDSLSLGPVFFQARKKGRPVQRMVVIRLAKMERLKPLYD